MSTTATSDSAAPSCRRPAVAVSLLACVAAPMLLAHSAPPSPTVLNQAVAIAAWGVLLVVLSRNPTAGHQHLRLARCAALVSAIALLAATSLLNAALGATPWPLAWSGATSIVTALIIGLSATTIRAESSLLTAWFAAWALTGVVCTAVGVTQVFAPTWIDGDWIAHSGMAGRAVGNLRQPNHMATLLLWSLVSVVPLFDLLRGADSGHARRAAALVFVLLLLFGIVLTGSRTGFVGVIVLALWALLAKQLPRTPRWLLILAPLFFLAEAWLLDTALGSGAAVAPVGVSTRLGEGLATSRYSVWNDTFSLIAAVPWAGVGFGGFNFAWSLTPRPGRSGEFFDHTHNLPLQLAVELGIPLALLILGLLGWGLWQAFDRSRRVQGPDGVAYRAAFVMVLLMALHSQLEYPLWYAYFLLPTAFAWGLCLGARTPQPAQSASTSSARTGSGWLRWAGIAMLVGAALMFWDYRRVVVIFAPDEGDTTPLAERIAEGQRSWFFAHHADYALVTTASAPVTQPGAFDRATHYLLDTRLMIAWAQSLAAQGDVDRARHLAARLREFKNPASKPFFEPCDDPQVKDKPFQCAPPERAYDWRDFRPDALKR